VRTGDPDEMSLTELKYFIDNLGFGLRPVQVYQTRWHRRLASLLVPLLMIAVCLPLAARFRGDDGGRTGAGAAVAGGLDAGFAAGDIDAGVVCTGRDGAMIST